MVPVEHCETVGGGDLEMTHPTQNSTISQTGLLEEMDVKVVLSLSSLQLTADTRVSIGLMGLLQAIIYSVMSDQNVSAFKVQLLSARKISHGLTKKYCYGSIDTSIPILIAFSNV